MFYERPYYLQELRKQAVHQSINENKVERNREIGCWKECKRPIHEGLVGHARKENLSNYFVADGDLLKSFKQ